MSVKRLTKETRRIVLVRIFILMLDAGFLFVKS
jgi:hypothetical protein